MKILQFLRKLWDKAVALICRVPYDKLLHFVAGLIIASFFAIVVHWSMWCIVPVLLLALVKEFCDQALHPETVVWDLWDIVATLAGALPIVLWTAIASLQAGASVTLP